MKMSNGLIPNHVMALIRIWRALFLSKRQEQQGDVIVEWFYVVISERGLCTTIWIGGRESIVSAPRLVVTGPSNAQLLTV